MAKKQTKKLVLSNKPMSIWQLFLFIILAIVVFWLLGLILDFAKWLMDIVLVAALIVAIAWMVNQYLLSSQKHKR